MKIGQKEIELLKRFADHFNKDNTKYDTLITQADIVDFVGRENLRLPVVINRREL